MEREPYKIQFDIGTIKHLGLQMYSTLPPVISEMVSNAWDADAEEVKISIPIGALNDQSEIIIEDDGCGMTDQEVRDAYLTVGRDRRKEEGDHPTYIHSRKLMGRKGIGKFSGFGIAGEIEVETVRNGETSRLVMSYAHFEQNAGRRETTLPSLPPTGTLKKGTRITLRKISKFRYQGINIQNIRRGLARRFSVIGTEMTFQVKINENPITAEERDLISLLEKDADGNPYLWQFDQTEIRPDTGWTVSGWIGALNRTSPLADGIQRGVSILARGKMVQEPFIFDAVVGQQFALSYIIGELNAEFVDEAEDTISTTRNSLVWDTEPNIALKKWGEKEINKIARKWSDKRQSDNERRLSTNPLYARFVQESSRFDDSRVKKLADDMIRKIVIEDVIKDPQDKEQAIQMSLDFMEYDSFQQLANEVSQTDTKDVGKIIELFREWEIVEAKEMMRVTDGRIKTIEKLQRLVDENALEVPTLHNFLKEFPWVLDPRWNLIADEKTFSALLREKFPDDEEPEEDRRIDFLCVGEAENMIVVEIKRPQAKASLKQLEQIERYVNFMRDYVQRTTDPSLCHKKVVGYLLCGDLVDTWEVRQRRGNLETVNIYIRRYADLLTLVKDIHKDFLERYTELRASKKRSLLVATDEDA